jgi:hypothetical protein
VVPDPGRRRLYWLSTLTSTLAEINAIAHVDVWTLLIEMRRRGVLLAAIHGTDDRLFSMERKQQRVDVRLLDGFYSVEGGHQQLLLEPSRHGRLASEALLALERRRLRADNLRHVAIASMQNV